MKDYKIRVDDELAATIDRIAGAENRASSEFIGLLLRDWCFGIARRYRVHSDEDLERFRRARPTPRVTLKAKDRNAIFERDEGKCRHCGGQLLYDEPWHIDHLKPLSKGGGNELSNLALSCVRCNLEKAGKEVERAL